MLRRHLSARLLLREIVAPVLLSRSGGARIRAHHPLLDLLVLEGLVALQNVLLPVLKALLLRLERRVGLIQISELTLTTHLNIAWLLHVRLEK